MHVKLGSKSNLTECKRTCRYMYDIQLINRLCVYAVNDTEMSYLWRVKEDVYLSDAKEKKTTWVFKSGVKYNKSSFWIID